MEGDQRRRSILFFFFFLVLVSLGIFETHFCVSEDGEEDKKIFFIMIVI